MRSRIGLLSFCLIGSVAASALAADVSDLMTVDQATALNAEIPTYVTQLEAILQQHGQSCRANHPTNAFPPGPRP